MSRGLSSIILEKTVPNIGDRTPQYSYQVEEMDREEVMYVQNCTLLYTVGLKIYIKIKTFFHLSTKIFLQCAV